MKEARKERYLRNGGREEGRKEGRERWVEGNLDEGRGQQERK